MQSLMEELRLDIKNGISPSRYNSFDKFWV
jgi:hypothetical protein